MKSTVATVVFTGGLALAVAGCAAGVGGTAESHDTSGAQGTDPQQQRLASASLALEMAYDVQFVKGQVDRDALQPMVADVVKAMPASARAKAQAHMYDVIANGERDASEMTPEQRARIAAPVSADEMGPQQVEVIGAWGWGWPAFGAVGGLGFGGLGWGGGWGTTAAWTSTTTTAVGTAGWGFPGVGWGAGWAPGWGAVGWTPALGLGWGLGWGGLGAFGFPACGVGYGAALGYGGLGYGGYGGLGYGAALGVGVPGGWGF